MAAAPERAQAAAEVETADYSSLLKCFSSPIQHATCMTKEKQSEPILSGPQHSVRLLAAELRVLAGPV